MSAACYFSHRFGLNSIFLYSSDYLPYKSGGPHLFDVGIPAHSLGLNVVGAVTATGLKLPLLHLITPFNQWVYLDWLQNTAVPFLQQNHPHQGVLFNSLRWQHDGHRSHTTREVSQNKVLFGI